MKLVSGTGLVCIYGVYKMAYWLSGIVGVGLKGGGQQNLMVIFIERRSERASDG